MCRNPIWWALVVLVLVAVPLTAHAAVVNLAPNPSFEEDEIILDDASWEHWCTWSDTGGQGSTVMLDDTEFIDGSRSLRIDAKGSTAGDFIVANIYMSVKSGTRYTASFWAKAEAARPLTVQWKAWDNSVTWGTTPLQVTQNWAEYSFTIASQSANIKIEFLCGASTVPLWLDFAYVYEGPYVAGIEPSGTGAPGTATRPSPENEATDVPRDVVVGWKAGPWANTHNVYLGESFADVNAASATNPLGVLRVQGHDANTLDVGRLEFGKTYYWRVDEVNAPPDTAVFSSKIWSFTVEPYSYPIAGSLITPSASSSHDADTGPERTIDGSGLNASDQHSTTGDDMWLSGTGTPQWIQYAFDRVYKLDQMLVWNSNQTTEIAVGLGAKDVKIQYSTDGEDWADLGDFVFNRATGKKAYTANTTVDFQGIAARYVKLTISSNWRGLLEQYGLSEVRFYYVPVAAREPSPAPGAMDVAPQVTLNWRAGREAVSHDVYLSTDQQAVADGTAPMTTVAQAWYKTVIDLAQTYYWKVAEVNQTQTPTTWDSEVWSFSTAGYVVIDDFEQYGNDSPDRVFQTWLDGVGFSPDDFFPNGYGGNGTGSVVGYDPLGGDVMEGSVVHSGAKSAPFAYSNTASVPTSETTRTFDAPQDWTASSIETLTLYFYGDPNGTGNDPLWVKVTDQGSKSAKVTFGAAAGEVATALSEMAWTEWNIPLSAFAGVDLAKITSMTIGVGPGTGSGQLFLDDIRLYPARNISAPVTPVLAAWWKLDNNAQDSSGNGNNGTLNNGATYDAAGKIGAALSLDGLDDYVDCGNAASLNITDTITVAAWIKPSDTGNAQHNPFVIKGDQSYGLKHNEGNFIEFFIYDGDWYGANSPILTTAFNGTWHHVAGTYDGMQTKLYIDGKLVGSRLHAGVIAATTYNVNLGRNFQNTDRLYYGLIDDARIYHGVLPTADIVMLANP